MKRSSKLNKLHIPINYIELESMAIEINKKDKK